MKNTILIIIIFLFSCTSKIKIRRCIDGDTIVSTMGEKIRLAEIDAPESNQFYGLEARQALAFLIAGKCITLKRKGKDKYHRTIGELYLQDGTWINERMVLSGYAWSYNYDLIEDQRKAQREHFGMWQFSGNIEPYIWRKEHKH